MKIVFYSILLFAHLAFQPNANAGIFSFLRLVFKPAVYVTTEAAPVVLKPALVAATKVAVYSEAQIAAAVARQTARLEAQTVQLSTKLELSHTPDLQKVARYVSRDVANQTRIDAAFAIKWCEYHTQRNYDSYLRALETELAQTESTVDALISKRLVLPDHIQPQLANVNGDLAALRKTKQHLEIIARERPGKNFNELEKETFYLHRKLLVRQMRNSSTGILKNYSSASEYRKAGSNLAKLYTAELNPNDYKLITSPVASPADRHFPSKPVNLRITVPKTGNAVDDAVATLKLQATNIVLINLLPRTELQATRWTEYSVPKQRAYLSCGRSVQRIAERTNIRNVENISSRESFVEEIRKIRAEGDNRKFVIIGESFDESTVMLPNGGRIDVAEFRKLNDVVGLFCGSSKSLEQVPGLSVEGKLFTDEAEKILQSLVSASEGSAKPTDVAGLLKELADVTPTHSEILFVFGPMTVAVSAGEDPGSNPNTKL